MHDIVGIGSALHVSNIEKREWPLVVVERRAERRTIRQVNFIDGSKLELIQESGRVESGNLQHRLELDFHYTRENYPLKILARFHFLVNESDYEVRIQELGIKRFSTLEMPMMDRKYVESIPIVLKKLINQVIVSSEVEIN